MRLTLAALLVVCCIPHLRADWHQWRGPYQNGVSPETNLPEAWDPDEKENVVWINDVGGMSSPIVMNGRVYTFSRIGEEDGGDGNRVAGHRTQEVVVCIDAKSGEVLWRHAENMTQTDVPFHRIGWSNVVGDPETGRVYGLGAQGMLLCLDGKDGKVVWRRHMTEDFGLITTFGGRTPSPALDEDQLIVGGVAFGWGDNARSQHRLFALDKSTGELNWTNGTGGIPVDAPYNTPVISVINGQRLVILGAGDGGVHAFQVRTGKKVWSHKVSKRGLNASVVVDGARVYACSSEENVDTTQMGAVVCIDASGEQPKELWRREAIEAGFGSPTIHGGRLYVIDNGSQVHALDAMTGETLWKKRTGTIGKASLVYGDGKLYVPEANGRFTILGVEGERPEVLSKADVEGKWGREYDIFGSVAIAEGRVFLQTANNMYCIGSKPDEAQSVAESETVATRMDDEGEPGEVAWLQVRPADVVLRAGENVRLSVRAFDAQGRLVTGINGTPTWSIGQLTFTAPPTALPTTQPGAAPRPAPSTQPVTSKIGNLQGDVSADGVFTASATPAPQGGGVFAKLGDVEGFTRIRVLPPLPWKFDFENAPPGKPPLTWIGAGGKFEVRELSDPKASAPRDRRGADPGRPRVPQGTTGRVLVKPPNIDLYHLARTYVGSSDMRDYTVQADLTVGEKFAGDMRQMPDAGVINSRYALVLYGNHQRLELYVWPGAGSNALHKSVPFKWEPNEWYRVKLKVSSTGDKALVQGKAWPSDGEETADWLVQFESGLPNTNGAPGLVGESLVGPTKSEIFYDNVLVTPNEEQ